MPFSLPAIFGRKKKDPETKREYNTRYRPPEHLRIKVEDAIQAAGNGSRLADALGISRSAVYQWRPKYRKNPFIPVAAAKKLIHMPEIMDRLKEKPPAE